jgi:putative heme-binding domain-containing protein
MWHARFFVALAGLVLPAAAWQRAQGAEPSPPCWIWADAGGQEAKSAYLRRTFELSGEVRAAQLRGIADRRMQVWVNGQPLPEIAGFEQMSRRDVTGALRPGRNLVAVAAEHDGGPAGVLVAMRVELASGERWELVSDESWLASTREEAGWREADFAAAGWQAAENLGRLGAAPWGDPTGEVDDYNQWKQALGSALATDPRTVQALPGFQVDLLRSAAADEGSWVSLAVDPHGRLIVAREDRGLLRLTLAADHVARVETIDDTLQECRGLAWAGECLYVNANNSKGFYRLRDADGDGRLEEVRLLRATLGEVGHGRNDVVLGPDGGLYLVHGNDVAPPPELADPAAEHFTSAVRHVGADRLLPVPWDRHFLGEGGPAPAGHVLRTDPEGRRWELLAGGFRNPYGLDFHPDGEMFTYDADMERDVGAAWYRPTRVNHVVSGGEYGWRPGTAKWPDWYPDSLPSTLDIGLGSPTAVKFGTRSAFPPRYQRALFILDWAYGRILAVHLAPRGASYLGQAEEFLRGRPLNVTDLDFGPRGEMYFVIGGRGTQSGLYRVRYVGPPQTEPPPDAAQRAAARDAAQARALRRRLEAFHHRPDPAAVAFCWPHLGSNDPWLRFAARVAVERQPLAAWESRALAEGERLPSLVALLALARVGPPEVQARLLDRLGHWSWPELNELEKLHQLRGLQLSLIRQGRPADTRCRSLAAQLEPAFPDSSPRVNWLLVELLAYLESPQVVARAMPLLEAAAHTADRWQYLLVLRQVRSGWTAPLRKTYFDQLRLADQQCDIEYQQRMLDFVRADAVALLGESERKELGPLALRATPQSALSPDVVQPIVKRWTLAELTDAAAPAASAPDPTRGRRAFAAAQCIRCHRFRGEGRAVGPDLDQIAGRMNRRDLLEAIVLPSKVVDEKFRHQALVTDEGRIVVGRIVGEDDQTLTVATDPVDATRVERLAKSAIESRRTASESPMPERLLDTLTRDEILDLLAYLASGGPPGGPAAGATK